MWTFSRAFAQFASSHPNKPQFIRKLYCSTQPTGAAEGSWREPHCPPFLSLGMTSPPDSAFCPKGWTSLTVHLVVYYRHYHPSKGSKKGEKGISNIFWYILHTCHYIRELPSIP